jgi:hypothetical protein
MRFVGRGVHREFCEVAILGEGRGPVRVWGVHEDERKSRQPTLVGVGAT